MQFIAFGDLEAKVATVKKIVDLKLNKYDAVIFTGDIPDPSIFRKLSKEIVESGLHDLNSKDNIAQETEPDFALKQVESEFSAIEPLFAQIKQKTEFIGVWGNADNTKMLARVPVSSHLKILHNQIFQLGEYFFVGYNGRPIYKFEKENLEQWAFSEDQLYADLDQIFKTLDGKKIILVTHAPPYGILDQVAVDYRHYAVGTYGDKAKDGHIGSYSLRKIVDKYHPFLHLFGHIHEAKGVEKIDNTTFINGGSTGHDSDYVEIKIENDQIKVNFNNI